MPFLKREKMIVQGSGDGKERLISYQEYLREKPGASRTEYIADAIHADPNQRIQQSMNRGGGDIFQRILDDLPDLHPTQTAAQLSESFYQVKPRLVDHSEGEIVIDEKTKKPAEDLIFKVVAESLSSYVFIEETKTGPRFKLFPQIQAALKNKLLAASKKSGDEKEQEVQEALDKFARESVGAVSEILLSSFSKEGQERFIRESKQVLEDKLQELVSEKLGVEKTDVRVAEKVDQYLREADAADPSERPIPHRVAERLKNQESIDVVKENDAVLKDSKAFLEGVAHLFHKKSGELSSASPGVVEKQVLQSGVSSTFNPPVDVLVGLALSSDASRKLLQENGEINREVANRLFNVYEGPVFSRQDIPALFAAEIASNLSEVTLPNEDEAGHFDFRLDESGRKFDAQLMDQLTLAMGEIYEFSGDEKVQFKPEIERALTARMAKEMDKEVGDSAVKQKLNELAMASVGSWCEHTMGEVAKAFLSRGRSDEDRAKRNFLVGKMQAMYQAIYSDEAVTPSIGKMIEDMRFVSDKNKEDLSKLSSALEKAVKVLDEKIELINRENHRDPDWKKMHGGLVASRNLFEKTRLEIERKKANPHAIITMGDVSHCVENVNAAAVNLSKVSVKPKWKEIIIRVLNKIFGIFKDTVAAIKDQNKMKEAMQEEMTQAAEGVSRSHSPGLFHR